MTLDCLQPLVESPPRFTLPSIPVTIRFTLAPRVGSSVRINRKRFLTVADTTKIADKLERKKIKRAARKKAAPKAKRTTPRGSNKQKVKKLARGQSKR